MQFAEDFGNQISLKKYDSLMSPKSTSLDSNQSLNSFPNPQNQNIIFFLDENLKEEQQRNRMESIMAWFEQKSIKLVNLEEHFKEKEAMRRKTIIENEKATTIISEGQVQLNSLKERRLKSKLTICL